MLKTSSSLDEALKTIKNEYTNIIIAPFFGAMIAVEVRYLTDAQISSCGSISLIETFEDKLRQKKAKYNMREIVENSKRMHCLVRESLVRPTYAQIIEQIGKNRKILDAQKKLEDLKKLLRTAPNTTERRAIEEEINNVKIWTNYILPENFMAFIVSFVLRIDDSDIKKITKKTLIEAAILAERGHDNPHDHLDGFFTPFMDKDIDRRAWFYRDQERKNDKINAR